MIPRCPINRRVILHVGPHKTASTSFQVSLNKNRKLLQQQGITVYRPRNKSLNAVELVAAFQGRGSDKNTILDNLKRVAEEFWHLNHQCRIDVAYSG